MATQYFIKKTYSMFYLLLFSFFSFLNPPHDIAMAVFAVTLEANTLKLQVQLDRGDIENALNISTKEEHSTKMIQEYVSTHAIWIINNQPTEFIFTTIKKNEEHYLLEATPIPFTSPFTTIDLHNTCLIEEVAKHSNVIYIKQKDKEMRGFRMNKNRIQISVDL